MIKYCKERVIKAWKTTILGTPLFTIGILLLYKDREINTLLNIGVYLLLILLGIGLIASPDKILDKIGDLLNKIIDKIIK